MTFKTNTELYISREELNAAAGYQQTIDNLTRSISSIFGQEIPLPELSTMDKLKLFLHGEKVTKNGPLTMTVSRKGVLIEINIDKTIDESIAIEYFQMVGDVVSIYVPAVTGAMSSLMAAQVVADERINQGVKKIAQSLKMD